MLEQSHKVHSLEAAVNPVSECRKARPWVFQLMGGSEGNKSAEDLAGGRAVEKGCDAMARRPLGDSEGQLDVQGQSTDGMGPQYGRSLGI